MFQSKIITKVRITFLFVLVFAMAFLKYENVSAVEIPDEEKWTNYDDYIVIDTDTTWSGQVVYDDPYKPVAIVNGATLTIEKGTAVNHESRGIYGQNRCGRRSK